MWNTNKLEISVQVTKIPFLLTRCLFEQNLQLFLLKSHQLDHVNLNGFQQLQPEFRVYVRISPDIRLIQPNFSLFFFSRVLLVPRLSNN